LRSEFVVFRRSDRAKRNPTRFRRDADAVVVEMSGFVPLPDLRTIIVQFLF
jgi:hypothetical protein